MSDIYTFSNPVFADFAFYGTVASLKMMGMSPMTAILRHSRGVMANQEDYMGKKDKKPIFDDDVIERVRRNHLNDLENIPVFILIGAFYVATKPSPSTALWHFRAFVASRFLHTLSYQLPLPQPARGFFFHVGLVATLSMAVQVLRQLA